MGLRSASNNKLKWPTDFLKINIIQMYKRHILSNLIVNYMIRYMQNEPENNFTDIYTITFKLQWIFDSKSLFDFIIYTQLRILQTYLLSYIVILSFSGSSIPMSWFEFVIFFQRNCNRKSRRKWNLKSMLSRYWKGKKTKCGHTYILSYS